MVWKYSIRLRFDRNGKILKKNAKNPEHKGIYTSPLLVEEDSLEVINMFGDSLF